MPKINTVAFDIDGTLIGYDGTPQKDIIALLKSYIKLGCTVYVWSGGGMKYVENVCRKLGIENLVIMSPKRGIIPDITYDDQEVNLGGINIQVRPKMY